MSRWRILAVTLAMGFASTSAAQVQPARFSFAPAEAPPYKYAVTPQAGEWLICVQTFKEVQSFRDEKSVFTAEQARRLAEEMAEYIQREYKLSAYLDERGRKERAEEQKRVQAIRDQYWDSLEKMKLEGLDPVQSPLRYRTIKTPFEYAVLVGKPNSNLQNMDAANSFLIKEVRKLKPPPKEFSQRAFLGNEDLKGKSITQTDYAYLNPFLTAMLVHNPTIPLAKQQDDPEKADKFLLELNAEESLSVLKCSKPWTLVVKLYQGQVLQAPKGPSLMSKLGLTKNDEILSASAAQAHATAEFLRKMKPSFDAYVMHHRQYSIVTVGQYDSLTDPNLLAAQKALAGMQIKQTGGLVLETLSAQPAPMKIPR